VLLTKLPQVTVDDASAAVQQPNVGVLESLLKR